MSFLLAVLLDQVSFKSQLEIHPYKSKHNFINMRELLVFLLWWAFSWLFVWRWITTILIITIRFIQLYLNDAANISIFFVRSYYYSHLFLLSHCVLMYLDNAWKDYISTEFILRSSDSHNFVSINTESVMVIHWMYISLLVRGH